MICTARKPKTCSQKGCLLRHKDTICSKGRTIFTPFCCYRWLFVCPYSPSSCMPVFAPRYEPWHSSLTALNTTTFACFDLGDVTLSVCLSLALTLLLFFFFLFLLLLLPFLFSLFRFPLPIPLPPSPHSSPPFFIPSVPSYFPCRSLLKGLAFLFFPWGACIPIMSSRRKAGPTLPVRPSVTSLVPQALPLSPGRHLCGPSLLRTFTSKAQLLPSLFYHPVPINIFYAPYTTAFTPSGAVNCQYSPFLFLYRVALSCFLGEQHQPDFVKYFFPFLLHLSWNANFQQYGLFPNFPFYLSYFA